MAVSFPVEEENSFQVEGMAVLVETSVDSSWLRRDKNADDDDDAADDGGYRCRVAGALHSHLAPSLHWQHCQPVNTTQ